jgi:hypothetical protein
MNRLALIPVIGFALNLLIFPVHASSPELAATNKTARIQIIKGPALESATDNSAIIRWTTNTGGDVIERSVVHYGTDRKHLDRKADSPNRWNQNLPSMIHRVSVLNLTPGTKYYYTVESVRGDGTPLGGGSSTVNKFTTRQRQ